MALSEAKLHEAAKSDEHEVEHFHQVAFYTFPQQRQRWGDHQVHPHTNWGDIFFDLFYVVSAYNLGNVLREDPTVTGFLYVAALFFPIQNLWTAKMFYDARFYYKNDYFHRLYEIALLLALASAVLYIRPVAILSNTREIDIFVFCLSILLANVLALGRLIEIMLCQRYGKDQQGLFPESFVATRRDSIQLCMSTMFLLAATIYSGVNFYGQTDGSEMEAKSTTDDHRLLASDEAVLPQDNVPIWLLLSSTFFMLAASVVRYIQFTLQVGTPSFYRSTVPMNVNYAIHRYGEWTMLMLGESILSLLIVDIVKTPSYFETFLCGIVTIVLLEYLHFQSQPANPDEHAYRRSISSGMTFFWLMQVYSLSLIILGTSYKMLLYEHLYAKEDDGYERNMFGRSLNNRFLAGAESAALRFSSDDRQQRIAHFFAASLTGVFVCMDIIAIAHRGIKGNWKRYEHMGCHKKKKLLVLHVALRIAVSIFTATVSQYLIEPNILAVVGLLSVLCQLCLRIVSSSVFDYDPERAEEETVERVINYNAARMHNLPEHTDSLRGEAGSKTKSMHD